MPKTNSLNWTFLFPFLIIAAGAAAYHNSLSGPFIFDDSRHLLENDFQGTLWPVWRAFEPWSPRSFAKFSFSLNAAISGENVMGYHLTNLLIHLLGGCALFGILRRTFQNASMPKRYQVHAAWLGGLIALLWVVHPLQTQSVTYIIQRAESLMGLLYLATLYFAIRGMQADKKRFYGLSIACCLLGMMSKQVMVTVPVVVLIYDRLFRAESFRQAFSKRWGLYAGYAFTWLVLFFLIWLDSFRVVLATAGFQLSEITPLQYAMTQPAVILHYLRLAFWPHPLILDYHWLITREFQEALLPASVIAAMLGLTVWGFLKRSRWSFLGVCFFLILSPTSSFVPIADVAFEHRMYLPLAAVITLIVMIGFELFKNQVLTLSVFMLAALSLGWTTIQRNKDYSSSLAIWMDTVQKRPLNPRAQNNVGKFLLLDDRPEEAIAHFQEALRLYPQLATVHNNLGITYGEEGDNEKAVRSFMRALEINPDFADSHYNLGVVLNDLNRLEEASVHLQKAIDAEYRLPKAHNNMGIALMKLGQVDAAVEQLHLALSYDPELADAYNNLGIAMMKTSRPAESLDYFKKTLTIDPENAQAHNNLGILLIQEGKFDTAIIHFEAAAASDPDYIDVHRNLGTLHARQGNTEKAVAYYQHVLTIDPENAKTHSNLGALLMNEGDLTKAETHLREAVRLDPSHQQAKQNLENLLTLKKDNGKTESI